MPTAIAIYRVILSLVFSLVLAGCHGKGTTGVAPNAVGGIGDGDPVVGTGKFSRVFIQQAIDNAPGKLKSVLSRITQNPSLFRVVMSPAVDCVPADSKFCGTLSPIGKESLRGVPANETIAMAQTTLDWLASHQLKTQLSNGPVIADIGGKKMPVRATVLADGTVLFSEDLLGNDPANDVTELGYAVAGYLYHELFHLQRSDRDDQYRGEFLIGDLYNLIGAQIYDIEYQYGEQGSPLSGSTGPYKPGHSLVDTLTGALGGVPTTGVGATAQSKVAEIQTTLTSLASALGQIQLSDSVVAWLKLRQELLDLSAISTALRTAGFTTAADAFSDASLSVPLFRAYSATLKFRIHFADLQAGLGYFGKPENGGFQVETGGPLFYLRSQTAATLIGLTNCASPVTGYIYPVAGLSCGTDINYSTQGYILPYDPNGQGKPVYRLRLASAPQYADEFLTADPVEYQFLLSHGYVADPAAPLGSVVY